MLHNPTPIDRCPGRSYAVGYFSVRLLRGGESRIKTQVMPPEYIAILFWFMGALPLIVHAVERAETRGIRRAIAFYLVAVSVWAVIVYAFFLTYLRAMTYQPEGSAGAYMWWAFGAIGAVSGVFLGALDPKRPQPLGSWVRPQVLRYVCGIVMLVFPLTSVVAWHLLV
jgi:hypothetical protein